MHLDREGKCTACKGGGRKTNLTPQLPLIGMIFTTADPRYAGRLDDKQGGDTIVTMENVNKAIAFIAELADESTWLWLTLEQIAFPLRPTGGGEHEEKSEDLDSSQRAHDHLFACHSVPVIADFILDENRKCCDNKLEKTIKLLHSKWSKEIEPLKLNTSFTYRQQPNRQERFGVHVYMRGKCPQCQRPHTILASFLSKKHHLVIWNITRSRILDQEIPADGFNRIQHSSQVWKSEWTNRESS